MLAVIPSRTDPTRPLAPQAFKNMLFLSAELEAFVRDLAHPKRAGAWRAFFGFALAGLGLILAAMGLAPEADGGAFGVMLVLTALAGFATLIVAAAIPLRDY